MEKNLKISDSIKPHDNFAIEPGGNGLWARTEIIAGYGDIIKNPTGKSTLGEEIFHGHNMVPIGGVSYVMENMFGVPENQIIIPTLYSTSGIGHSDSAVPTETYITPEGTASVIYRYGHFTQLFGVGITGTGENDVSIYDVDYRENSINITKQNPEGLTVTGLMLPFRYTTEVLDTDERKQYFGKKVDEFGITGYYLKKFEGDAVIKHIWKTGEEDDTEELVSPDDVWSVLPGANAVESFCEMYLKITKKDMKEWFIAQDQADRTRINTIALFNGQFIRDDESGADGDYRDCRMMSKLCINPEYLTLSKDLNIIYRVYGN